jgi:hypothetical protein
LALAKLKSQSSKTWLVDVLKFSTAEILHF